MGTDRTRRRGGAEKGRRRVMWGIAEALPAAEVSETLVFLGSGCKCTE